MTKEELAEKMDEFFGLLEDNGYFDGSVGCSVEEAYMILNGVLR